MPLLVGIPGLALSALQLVFDLKRKQETEIQGSRLEALQWRILFWLATCIPSIVLLGFDLGTPVMVAVYHRFVQREKLAYLLASTFVAFIIVALVLDKLFAAQLFPGLLTPTIVNWFKGL
ncbi:MAG: hypothetical protein ABIN69_18180 [Aestuariivirga sp.]